MEIVIGNTIHKPVFNMNTVVQFSRKTGVNLLAMGGEDNDLAEVLGIEGMLQIVVAGINEACRQDKKIPQPDEADVFAACSIAMLTEAAGLMVESIAGPDAIMATKEDKPPQKKTWKAK